MRVCLISLVLGYSLSVFALFGGGEDNICDDHLDHLKDSSSMSEILNALNESDLCYSRLNPGVESPKKSELHLKYSEHVEKRNEYEDQLDGHIVKSFTDEKIKEIYGRSVIYDRASQVLEDYISHYGKFPEEYFDEASPYDDVCTILVNDGKKWTAIKMQLSHPNVAYSSREFNSIERYYDEDAGRYVYPVSYLTMERVFHLTRGMESRRTRVDHLDRFESVRLVDEIYCKRGKEEGDDEKKLNDSSKDALAQYKGNDNEVYIVYSRKNDTHRKDTSTASDEKKTPYSGEAMRVMKALDR